MLHRLGRRATRLAVWFAAVALAAILVADTGRATEPAPGPAAAAAPAPVAAAAGSGSHEIEVPPPPFSEDIFPCSDCHDPNDKTNPTRRKLTEYHEDIVLRHDEQNRWCLDCHDEHNRDSLRLASGKLVPFEKSYLLCGQCHGPTLRSWKAGVHGKRTGRWDGAERRYLLCVHCHNPHHPRFPQVRPLPPPIAPGELRASLSRPLPPPVVIKPVSPYQSSDGDSEGDDGD